MTVINLCHRNLNAMRKDMISNVFPSTMPRCSKSCAIFGFDLFFQPKVLLRELWGRLSTAFFYTLCINLISMSSEHISVDECVLLLKSRKPRVHWIWTVMPDTYHLSTLMVFKQLNSQLPPTHPPHPPSSPPPPHRHSGPEIILPVVA